MAIKGNSTFSKVQRVSKSDGLVAYPRYSFRGSHPSIEMQLAYCTVQNDWANNYYDTMNTTAQLAGAVEYTDSTSAEE